MLLPDGRVLAGMYVGEFGHEMGSVLPFLHTLERCGLLAGTTSCGDLSAYYFFSPAHVSIDADKCRRYPGVELYMGFNVRSPTQVNLKVG